MSREDEILALVVRDVCEHVSLLESDLFIPFGQKIERLEGITNIQGVIQYAEDLARRYRAIEKISGPEKKRRS